MGVFGQKKLVFLISTIKNIIKIVNVFTFFTASLTRFHFKAKSPLILQFLGKVPKEEKF